MKRRKYTNSELGMMYGTIVGAVIGTLMFVFTHNAIWLTAIGVGVALGLSIGAGRDHGDS